VDHVWEPIGNSRELLGSDKNPEQKKKKLGPQVHVASPHWLEDFVFAFQCFFAIFGLG
jgi:hypothetical protein